MRHTPRMRRQVDWKLVHISRYIKNLESCGAAAGNHGRDNHTNHWGLDQL